MPIYFLSIEKPEPSCSELVYSVVYKDLAELDYFLD